MKIPAALTVGAGALQVVPAHLQKGSGCEAGFRQTGEHQRSIGRGGRQCGGAPATRHSPGCERRGSCCPACTLRAGSSGTALPTSPRSCCRRGVWQQWRSRRRRRWQRQRVKVRAAPPYSCTSRFAQVSSPTWRAQHAAGGPAAQEDTRACSSGAAEAAAACRNCGERSRSAETMEDAPNELHSIHAVPCRSPLVAGCNRHFGTPVNPISPACPLPAVLASVTE